MIKDNGKLNAPDRKYTNDVLSINFKDNFLLFFLFYSFFHHHQKETLNNEMIMNIYGRRSVSAFS